MEVDFMVRQVLLHNKIFILLISLFWVQCTTSEPKTEKMLKIPAHLVSNKNGLMYYENKLFSGTAYNLFPNQKDTLEIFSYLEGKEHGIWKKFYTNRQLREKREFREGKKVGSLFRWWENGTMQMHYVFEDNEYQGTCKEWNQAGLLVKEMNYQKGHEEGSQKWWYDNGKIKSNYIITNGRRFGLLGTKNCINVTDSIFKK
jgi:antitoxin component YwqK of YwqJK toxin-antitoxin module